MRMIMTQNFNDYKFLTALYNFKRCHWWRLLDPIRVMFQPKPIFNTLLDGTDAYQQIRAVLDLQQGSMSAFADCKAQQISDGCLQSSWCSLPWNLSRYCWSTSILCQFHLPVRFFHLKDRLCVTPKHSNSSLMHSSTTSSSCRHQKDRETQLKSGLFCELNNFLDTTHLRVLFYPRSTNGIDERFNRALRLLLMWQINPINCACSLEMFLLTIKEDIKFSATQLIFDSQANWSALLRTLIYV